MKPIIVGEIQEDLACKIGIEAAKIEIYKRSLIHISQKHKTELAQLGMTGLAFVKFILQSFTEIRKGKRHELFLIVRSRLSKVAIIRMNFERKAYKIESATVMEDKYLKNKDLIWKK